MICPPSLKPGDTIAIVSPAKAIEAEHIDFAKSFFEAKGFRVMIGKYAYGRHNYFSATDEQRQEDLQWAIDHPEVKAIICARGGYGCVRLTTRMQWANLLREPKWIVGFSDLTAFLSRTFQLGYASIHAPMTKTITCAGAEVAAESLRQMLFGEMPAYEVAPHALNRTGNAVAQVVGGNL